MAGSNQFLNPQTESSVFSKTGDSLEGEFLICSKYQDLPQILSSLVAGWLTDSLQDICISNIKKSAGTRLGVYIIPCYLTSYSSSERCLLILSGPEKALSGQIFRLSPQSRPGGEPLLLITAVMNIRSSFPSGPVRHENRKQKADWSLYQPSFLLPVPIL